MKVNRYYTEGCGSNTQIEYRFDQSVCNTCMIVDELELRLWKHRLMIAEFMQSRGCLNTYLEDDCFLHYCNACIELIENVSFVIVGEYERFKDNRRHKREMKDTLDMIRAESIEYVRCLIKNKEKENEDLVKRLKEWEDLGHKYGVWCASRLDEVIQEIERKR